MNQYTLNSTPAQTSKEIILKETNQEKYDTNGLLFSGVDSLNRPVFHRSSNDGFYCSVDTLFNIGETVPEEKIQALLSKFQDRSELLYIKSSGFDGEPSHPVNCPPRKKSNTVGLFSIIEIRISNDVFNKIKKCGTEAYYFPVVDMSPVADYMILDLNFMVDISTDVDVAELKRIIKEETDICVTEFNKAAYVCFIGVPEDEL